jgi:hypothetical protein
VPETVRGRTVLTDTKFSANPARVGGLPFAGGMGSRKTSARGSQSQAAKAGRAAKSGNPVRTRLADFDTPFLEELLQQFDEALRQKSECNRLIACAEAEIEASSSSDSELDDVIHAIQQLIPMVKARYMYVELNEVSGDMDALVTEVGSLLRRVHEVVPSLEESASYLRTRLPACETRPRPGVCARLQPSGVRAASADDDGLLEGLTAPSRPPAASVLPAPAAPPPAALLDTQLDWLRGRIASARGGAALLGA